MRNIFLFLALLSSLLSQSTMAVPIFVNVADKYGLAEFKDRLRVLEDSEDEKMIYFLPASLTLPSAFFSGLPIFLSPPIASRFFVTDLGSDQTRIDFFVVPEMDLLSLVKIIRITAEQAKVKGFKVYPLNCFDPKLSLLSIAPQLLSKVSQADAYTVLQETNDPVFGILSQVISPEDIIPGYFTRLSIFTHDEAQVSELLFRHGAVGQAEFACLGYTADMQPKTEAPILVNTSVPLLIKFK